MTKQFWTSCSTVKCWAALLVIALFPTGGTALQDATELVVTLPLLLALVHWIAPSVRAVALFAQSAAAVRRGRQRRFLPH